MRMKIFRWKAIGPLLLLLVVIAVLVCCSPSRWRGRPPRR